MTTYSPVILAAELLPNPALVGERVLLSVSVIDAELIEQAETRLSAEFRSGEV